MEILIYILIYLLGCITSYFLLKKIVVKYIDDGETSVWKFVRFQTKANFIYIFSWLGVLGALWLLLLLSLTPEKIEQIVKSLNKED